MCIWNYVRIEGHDAWMFGSMSRAQLYRELLKENTPAPSNPFSYITYCDGLEWYWYVCCVRVHTKIAFIVRSCKVSKYSYIDLDSFVQVQFCIHLQPINIQQFMWMSKYEYKRFMYATVSYRKSCLCVVCAYEDEHVRTMSIV